MSAESDEFGYRAGTGFDRLFLSASFRKTITTADGPPARTAPCFGDFLTLLEMHDDPPRPTSRCGGFGR
ncbi:hypothetical protein V1J52_25765 [Streptomyces sp. TRM 70351]|uniref:hypothetical protein n=1 Tax=Streptomyces sp. TRM 70351 TaxID=3116552 RepID=UPI002E7BB0ED|nr:hypothetical protein [Streptomyces sp. TRM 70351]MEE1931530.1 hypothetical protein [Streptomyces sp. TRM 70351]